MRPVKIPASILKYIDVNSSSPEALMKAAHSGYLTLLKNEPEVSIIIPAYNEELNIVPTLASLCQNKTARSVEIIVVDNNSKDKTAHLANACGVNCIRETQQGITFARNKGLSIARGKYILNADADSIYPEQWIESMVKPLEDEGIALTYGRFSLIPTGNTGRLTYFFYEYIAELSRFINKKVKDEAVNVYGFNSGFRRVEGLSVDSFNHPIHTNEDGWLALKLRDKGYGKLHLVTSIDSLVWTTDRRIQLDGGLMKGFLKRFKRMLKP
ncbi:glycosyltransferase family 2 protein [Pedobacter immunditicola]|uniref:glycosyltransferase family 2 protein n=1 Tax=Pedobacter immunditicola TaxID=3133440 RepID=UPI0030A5ED60